MQRQGKEFLLALGHGLVRFFGGVWSVIRHHPAGFGGAALGAAVGGLMYAKGRHLLRWGKKKKSSSSGATRRERRRSRAY